MYPATFKSFRLFCIFVLYCIAPIVDPFSTTKNSWSKVVTDYVMGFEKGASDVHYRIIASKPNIGRIASLENTNSANSFANFA